MQIARLPVLALAGLLAAVLVAPVQAQGVELKPTAKVKHDKYLITADEIAEHREVKDGYDVVRLLRNQWLRLSFARSTSSRPTKPNCDRVSTDPACVAGSGSSGAPMPSERGSPYADSDGGGATAAQFLPVVYIDEIKREGVNDLRSLRPADIFEMRFLTGNQAVGRYGSGYENGAIMVKTVGFGRG